MVRLHSRYNAQALSPPLTLQFLALDEVFDGLDKEGQEAVFSILEALSSKVRQVFLVSHAPIPGLRANTIRCLKDEEGNIQYEIVKHY